MGSWKGTSAVHMAQLVKARGLDCKIVCIDTWLGGRGLYCEPDYREDLLPVAGRYRMLEIFLTNVHRLGLADTIFAMPSTSRDAAHALTTLGVQVDLIYIDGGHLELEVREDLEGFWPAVRPGGVLFGDDYVPRQWPGVVKAADEFAARIGVPLVENCSDFVLRKPA